jgi:O-antigen ligase
VETTAVSPASRLALVPPGWWATLGLLAFATAVGAFAAVAFSSVDRPAWMMVAGALGAAAVFALAVVRYELAVALGFVLFAVVAVEPAPPDAIFAIAIVVGLATGRIDLRRVPLGPAIGVAAFVALNLLAFMEAVSPRRATTFMSITIYLLVFALWIPTWVTNRARARSLVRIVVVIGAVSAVLGVVALFVSTPGHDVLTAYTGTRARALFKDPNVFGPFLVVPALFLIQEILAPRLLRMRRLTKLVLLGVMTLGILFSYSRAAWLNYAVAVVVMGAVLALRRRGSRRAVVFVGLVVLTAVVGSASIAATGKLSFLEERARPQVYDTQRFGAQRGGIALGEEYPLGVGPGQFELYEPISAHSTYVRALAEEGVVGLAVLGMLMLGTFGMALRNAVRGWDTHGISSTVLLAAWCGILANSLFIDTLHWRHLWLVAGLVWAAAAAHRPSSAATRPRA